jgi:bifunctional UDP-N-acetylglucosamine pyrophosphorylase/glucosamine-1-phosphate N-acetyltransferase
MQAIILAGGIGKRIAPLGINKPKAMFQIMGKPLIHHVIEMISEAGAGIEEVIVVISPGESPIQDYLTAHNPWGFSLKFAIQEQPLGQANALLSARHLVKDNMVVMNANDIYAPSLLKELVALGEQQRLDVGLVGRRVPDPNRFGVMAFDPRGKLIGVVEKPPEGKEPSNIAVVGLYYFSPSIWKALDATPLGDTDDQLERAYQKCITDGRGDYIEYDDFFESYKFPWDLLKISDLLLNQKCTRTISPQASISPLAHLDGNVTVEDGARVLEFAVIRGPAYIGKNCIIGNHTLLRGGVSLGENCVVGFSTEISHSLLGNSCWTHKNFIGDSIVSDNCSFGAGTITANLRFDEKAVKVNVAGKRISSGMEHFGVILAEDCRTGCNAVLLPGVKIGPNSAVGPGVVLKEDLPPHQMALLDKDSYQVIENKIDIHSLSREERMKKLKK